MPGREAATSRREHADAVLAGRSGIGDAPAPAEAAWSAARASRGHPTASLGIGVDVVDVARLARMGLRWGQPLLEHLFTAAEQAASRGARGLRWPSLAGRLAAKEAAKKVLASRGHAAGWTEIEVRAGVHGEPLLRLHGRALAAAERCGFDRLLVSIAHERDVAVAVVLAVPERKEVSGWTVAARC